MPLKRLFLSHYNQDAAEVQELATELRLRGVPPWVDKQGGFTVGDDSAIEARRAIRDDCFGLLLYATKDVFKRRFIRDVEIDEAAAVRRCNPAFLLFTVPRQLGFAALKKLSLDNYGVDLSTFHSVPVPDSAVQAGHVEVAVAVLEKVLRRSPARGSRSISLQYSTRELFPDENEDVLCVNATDLLSQGADDLAAWGRLVAALRDVKRQVSARYGRPRLYVHGSKHITAAFIFGRVFAPFEIDIRQTPEQVWRTDVPPCPIAPLLSSFVPGRADTGRLFIEVASGYKNVPAAVDTYIANQGVVPALRLQLRPHEQPLNVDNAICCAMVAQTYAEIEKALQQHEQIDEIHLFAAAPQAFMMMLGRAFKGMPPTYLYEWTGSKYVFACRVPDGVF